MAGERRVTGQQGVPAGGGPVVDAVEPLSPVVTVEGLAVARAAGAAAVAAAPAGSDLDAVEWTAALEAFGQWLLGRVGARP